MSQNPLHRSELDQLQTDQIFQAQRDFFQMGKTFDVEFRLANLKKLKQLIKDNEKALLEALAADFDKPEFEAYASEIGFVYAELNHSIQHLKEWARPKRVSSPLATWPSRSYVIPQPKGTCLIIGPWNYPFMLMMAPLCAALGAGNTVFLKPPEQCVHTSNLISDLLTANFDQELITVVQGEGHLVIPPLLEKYRFDHIFFTGSTEVGRSIAQMAAKKLVPCTLELGGKSPAIVDQSANLKVAAQRIAFGKWLNAGQTCVAPDYLLVERPVYNEFIGLLKETIQSFYPEGALASKDYTSIIHEKHYQRMVYLMEEGEVIFGGEKDPERRRIAPTLIVNPNRESALMQEEIFGPLLPIIPFDFKEEARAIVDENPNPLAFYLFSENRDNQDFWKQLPFGGGAINNATVHLANPDLPFGGIGNSGNGHYHGKFGFDTFSHSKAIMKTSTWLDPREKYPPYSNLVYKVVKWLMS